MKRTWPVLLAILLALSISGLCEGPVSLENLTLEQLEALRQEADGRIRLLLLPDAGGYIDVAQGEAYARDPSAHLSEKVKLDGEILRVDGQADEFRYYVSLDGNPSRVFAVWYTLGEGERLLLAGDPVTAYGVFEGLAPFSGDDLIESGAPVVKASLVTQRLPKAKRLAADPFAATRDDPAPLGAAARYEGSYWSGYASFELEMVSSLRGTAALKKAQEMSKYNVTPLRTQEYLLAWIRVKALSVPGGRAEIGNEDFSFVSSDGSEYNPHYLLNSPDSLRSLYEGGEYTGLIACVIEKGDNPLIVYQSLSENPLWFDPNRSR